MRKENKPIIRWVTKMVNKRVYDREYKDRSGCCNLGVIRGDNLREKVKIGFMTVGSIQPGCQAMDDEELKIMDDYLRACKISPRPYIK